MTAKQSFHGEVQSNLYKLKPNNIYLFNDPNHRKELVDVLHSLRRNGSLCDVTIRHGKRKLACHRIILGSASPFFRALFVESESGKFVKNVEIPEDIDYKALEATIDYLYGGTIYLTPLNTVGVLRAACLFKLQALTDECSFALTKYLTSENCFQVKDIALLYGQKKLCARSWKFICKNFPEVCFGRQFLEQNEQKLEEIISCDDVHATEEQIFDALVRWTNFDRKERGVHFAKLLRFARLPLMNTTLLVQHVENEELVQRSPSAKEMVMEAMRFNMADSVNRATLQSPRTMVRTWSKMVDVIMLVGGRGSSPYESWTTLCYEPREDTWYTLAPVPTVLYDHSVASVDGLVFSCGGSVEGRSSLLLQKDVHVFDPQYNQWSSVASMKEERAQFAAGGHDGLLYAIGGMINGPNWNAVEVYNPVSDRWTFLPKPAIPRSNHTLVTTETHLYVIGGDGHEIEPVISVERYDPSCDTWSFVLPMSCGKVGACAVVLNDRILVFGGSNGYHTMKQCEAYDMGRHQWKPITDMNEFRQNAEAVVVDGSAYVIGGRDFYGKRYLDTLERYNPSDDQWTVVSEIPIHKRGFKCIAIKISKDHLQPFVKTTKMSS